MPPDCRVYGNQYGHWVVFTGDLAWQIEAHCRRQNITPEQLLVLAVDEYVDRMEAVIFLEMEHQERMKEKALHGPR